MENAKKCYKALQEFGYDLSEISVEDLVNYKIFIRQYTLEVDIHPFVSGVKFEEVWANRVKAKIGGVETYFASLDDLIKMKEAAGRAKDKEDLKALLKIRENISKK